MNAYASAVTPCGPRKGPARVLLLGALTLGLLTCARERTTTVPEVVAVRASRVPSDPLDPAWDRAPVHVAPLLLQDIVEPRLLAASTPQVRVAAITDGSRIAFLMSWDDSTQSDVQAAGRFADACAVQFPAAAGPDLPAPQMGEQGRPVEITYWSASWQAVVDGRKQEIHSIYPNAKVDHYPFQAGSLAPGSEEQRAMEQRYAPAHAVHNPVSVPGDRPVQDLVAAGPGTLMPAGSTRSEGKGVHVGAQWRVLLNRPLPEAVGPGTAERREVAFAVWQGSRQEVGARKMRTGWIPMSVEAAR